MSPWFLLKGAQTRRMRLGGQYALDTDLSPEPAGAGLVASRNSIVRICLIFGAFDPLHLGHLRMGLEGMRCGLHDVVLYCPYTDRNRSTSSKPAKSRFAHRLALATAGGTNDLFPLFRVSEIGRRSYPFEALRQFVRANLRAFPDAFFSITYKVGSDVFPVLRDRLPLLHRSILQAGNGRVDLRFVVNQRPGSEVPKKQISDSPLSNLRIEFEWCETKGQVSAVSSSAIRSSPVASCHLWPRLMRCWPLVHARYAKRNHVPNP